MSLLDDVSIVVTPNGYKAGELYAVVPVPTEGAEEVTNGDFSGGNTGWSEVGDFAISGGKASITSASQYSQLTSQGTNFLTSGRQYKLQVDIETLSISGTLAYRVTGGAVTPIYTTEIVNGIYTKYFTMPSDGYIWFQTTGSYTGLNVTIDNVSVKEYTSADMDVTRATDATRVDENGLVNYAEIVGGEEVVNGDFSGGSTGWTISGAWSLGTNKVIFGDATNGDIRTTSAIFTASKTYQIKLTVADLTGANTAFFGIGDNSPSNLVGYDNYANGDYTFNAIAPNGSGLRIYSTTSSGSSYSITNISVKEVTRDNVPRIDYTGGGCPHILAEPQRTNLVTYSEDFTQWTKSNASLINTITSTVISPDGVSYANKLYPIGTGGYIKQTIAGDCFSIFVKKGERKWILIYGGFANSNVWFDSENGVLGTVKSEATATVESFGNDWYRIKILWTQNSTQVRIYNTDNDNTLVSTGNGTDGLYIWGAQLEAGSYATSYILTSGSTVTRNQDIFTRDGIGSLINSTEGVLFVEMAALSNDGTNRDISISDGTLNNRIYVFYTSSSNQISVQCKVGNVTQFSFTESISNATDFIKLAIKYKENDFALWIDGVEVDTDNSGITFSADTLNQLQFAVGGTYARFFGKVRQLQVYDTSLSDTQLAALTSL